MTVGMATPSVGGRVKADKWLRVVYGRGVICRIEPKRDINAVEPSEEGRRAEEEDGE